MKLGPPSIVLMLLAITGVCAAEQAPDLATGVDAYWKADYAQAERILTAVETTGLSRDEQELTHKFLALSLLAQGKDAAAEQQLEQLLALDPGYALSGEESPRVVESFQLARTTLARRLGDHGIEAYRSGDYEVAVDALERTLRLDANQPMARDFLVLAKAKLAAAAPPPPKSPAAPACEPSRAWGALSADGLSCQGKDFSAELGLPARANRLVLIYDRHAYGVGTCWRIELYDAKGNLVHTFDDAQRRFVDQTEPTKAERWITLDLPEIRTIARVRMYAQYDHGVSQFLAHRIGRIPEDDFILGLEVICKPDR